MRSAEELACHLHFDGIACKMHVVTSITVRDVPDETRDELAARAARTGRSLQEYLRATLIDLARRPDVDVMIERVRWHKSMTESTLPAHEILALKDEDRR